MPYICKDILGCPGMSKNPRISLRHPRQSWAKLDKSVNILVVHIDILVMRIDILVVHMDILIVYIMVAITDILGKPISILVYSIPC